MELVTIQFRRKANLSGGAMYLPGEIAAVTPAIASEFCHGDNPAATLITSKEMDAPANKMQTAPQRKKEQHA